MRPVIGFPGYVVTGDGIVYGPAGRLKQHVRSGYHRVHLRKYDGCFKRTVHVMVMMAFGPPRPSPLHEVDHIDRDRSNNHIENLRWATREEQERNKHPTKPRKSAVTVPEEDRPIVKRLHELGMPAYKIAELYGCHRSSIGRILKGRRK